MIDHVEAMLSQEAPPKSNTPIHYFFTASQEFSAIDAGSITCPE
jgi:hypothetical protein